MLNGPTSPSAAARRRWLWLGYWACIAIATHVPVTRVGIRAVPNIDKLLHVGMYFFLTLLGGWYLRATRQPLTGRVLALWALVYALYGVADECLQPFSGRTASLGDWTADAIGIALATVWLAWRSSGTRISEPVAARKNRSPGA